MKIEQTYVTFGQAKLLKEKGFDIECTLSIFRGTKDYKTIGKHSNTKDDFTISIPEQWQVIEWLRVIHGIWIHSSPENNEQDVVKWSYVIQKINIEVRFVKRLGEFNTPQEAYSTAFDYTLKELI